MIEETQVSAGKLLSLYMFRFSVYINKIYHGMFWNEENDMWALTECKSREKNTRGKGHQLP